MTESIEINLGVPGMPEYISETMVQSVRDYLAVETEPLENAKKIILALAFEQIITGQAAKPSATTALSLIQSLQRSTGNQIQVEDLIVPET